MSLDPAIFRALVAQGATPEMLLAVVEAAAAVDEEKRERKRAGNAERQQRFRDARAAERNNSNALCGVTERDGDCAPSLEVSPQTPLPKPTPTPGIATPRTRKAGSFPCPDGVEPQHWSDFLANRQRKRLANTPTAYRRVVADLTKLADDEWPPDRIVQFAAERGWAAIFDPRGKHDGQRNGHHRAEPAVGRSIAAAQDWLAECGPRH